MFFSVSAASTGCVVLKPLSEGPFSQPVDTLALRPDHTTYGETTIHMQMSLV